MDKITIHEVSAYLIPGMVTMYGFLLLFPSDMTFISLHNFTVGDFGIFTVLAYSVGHIVQILGRYIEKGIDKFKGDFKDKEQFKKLLSVEQRQIIEQKLRRQIIIFSKLENVPDNEWRKIYRTIYTEVVSSKQKDRIYVFKNHSKLCRGLGTGLLLLLFLYISLGRFQISQWFILLLFFVTIFAFFDRMRSFDKRDAEETYYLYINNNSSDI